MIPSGMKVSPSLCGWTLARAHARSGDRMALRPISAAPTKFDRAIADFAETYADQNERDYAALQAAAKDGRVKSTTAINAAMRPGLRTRLLDEFAPGG